VSLFKRILSFKETASSGEQRKSTRYAVGPDFPLKTVVNLFGRDGSGKLLQSPDGTGRDWAGKMLNLSTTGASMRLPNSAMAMRGEFCRLKFSIGDSVLEIPANVAHFKVLNTHCVVGLTLNFPDQETQAAYMQLLQPVAVGASLEAVDPKKVKQDTPGFHKDEFKGDNARLDIWRAGAANGTMQGFDFRMANYGVRWTDGMAELDTYGVVQGSDDPVEISEAQQVEVRWLFCLAVPNLSKAVPPDVREFFGRLVA
jgi:hypothetical protein